MAGQDRTPTAPAAASRRLRWSLVLLTAVALLASGCEYRLTPTGGFSLKPDTPNGARVLVIGDSLMRQASLSMAFSLMPAGVETLSEGVNTSGLLSGAVHWDVRAAELINQFHPTIVLIGFTGNFSPPYWPPYNPPGAEGSPEYQQWIRDQLTSDDYLARYTDAAHRLTALFQIAGVKVYWSEPPPYPAAFGNPSLPDKLWAKWKIELPRDLPDTELLFARSAVADAAGNWIRWKVICGTNYEIRSYEWDGGVHYTGDGAGTIGRKIARDLSAAEGWAPPPNQCPGKTD